MTFLLLPLVLRLDAARRELATRLVEVWADRHDERGVDEAVTKMIWLAVGIAVAVVATTFFIGVFDTARSNVPDPVPPAP